jgi:hypothetical protein
LARSGGGRAKKSGVPVSDGSVDRLRVSRRMPVKPSTSAWCTLKYMAKRPPSSPSMKCTSQGGR